MRRIKVIALMAFVLAMGISASYAQQGNVFTNFKSALSRADHEYNTYSYVAAIALYEEVLEKEPGNHYATLQIARAYKKINKPIEAEKWFRAAMEKTSSPDPIDQLNFAQILMTNGRYEEAKHWLVRYAKSKKDIRATNNLMGIERLEDFYHDSALYRMQNAKINAEGNDFSPVFYDSLLLFLSNREKSSAVKYVNSWTQKGFYDVYQSDISQSDNPGYPRIFNKSINSKYHEGPLAFYNKGKNMVFTRSITPEKPGEDRVLGLFVAEKNSDKGWGNVRALPFNSAEYSVFHPAITEAGDTLYFSSEKPGGYGGGDIYRSVKKQGQWGEPENMGSQINTEGSELFPYLYKGILYFSSDGHAGLGGLDLYEVVLYKGRQLQVVNMGYPLNSSYDDFGLVWQEYKKKGALSSNRPNGVGNDDIYFFEYAVQTTPQLVTLTGRVIDKSKGSASPDARVYILNEDTGEDYSLKVDEKGEFSFEGNMAHSYTILADNATKSGLISGKIIEDPSETIVIEIWGFPPYVRIEAQIKDKTTGQAIKLAKVKLQENGVVISQEQTSFDGRVSFMGNANGQYTLIATSPNYIAAEERIQIPEETTEDSFKVDLELEKTKPQLTLVTGKVIDRDQQTGIAAANVYVFSNQTDEKHQLTTKNDGSFTFEALVGNTYRIVGESGDNRDVLNDFKIKDPNSGDDQYPLLKIPIALPIAHDEKHALVVNLKDIKSQESISFGVVKLFYNDTIRSLDYTDIQGQLTLHVESGKNYLVTTDVLGYQPSTLAAVTTGDLPSDTLNLNFFLEPLKVRTISGVVIDPILSQRLGGASVYLINKTTGEEEELVTTAEGYFSFQGKEGDKLAILVETDKKKGAIEQISLTERHFSTPVQVKLYDKSKFVFVAINVIDAQSGEGIPLAEVQMKTKDLVQLGTSTDLWGNTNLKVKPGIDYTLDIKHAGYKGRTETVPASASSNDTLEIKLALERKVPEFIAMKGSVYLDGTRLSDQGSKIIIINTTTGESRTQYTDSLGNFEFQARVGEVYDIVGDYEESSGMVNNLVIQLPENSNDDNIRLPVKQLSRVQPLQPELIHYGLNKPIKQLINEYQFKLSTINGYVYDKTNKTAVNRASVYLLNNASGESQSINTDENGIFQFQGKENQEFTFLVDKGNKSGLYPYEKIAHVQDTVKLGIWGFPPPVVLQVNVLNQESKPVRLAMVGIKEAEGFSQQEQTQISGDVYLRAISGEKHILVATAEGYEKHIKEINIPVDNNKDTLKIELWLDEAQPQMVDISGSVLDELTGKAADSAVVYIMNSKSWEVEKVVTDHNGKFEFKGQIGAQYQVIGEKNSRGTSLKDVLVQEINAPVLLRVQKNFPQLHDLSNRVYLKVEVRDQSSGSIIPNARIKVSSQDTVRQNAYTTPEGTKVLLVNNNSSYYLEASMKNFLPAAQKVTTQPATMNDTLHIVLELNALEQKPELVSGYAVNGDNLKGVPTARIYIRNHRTGEEEEIISGSNGQFNFKGIPGDLYTILAEGSGKRGSLNNFLLTKEQLSSTVEITLYASTKPLIVKVKLKDEDNNEPIPLANMQLSYQETFLQKSISKLDGEGVFHAYSGKDYRLEVNHPAYKSKQLSIYADDEDQDTITVNATLAKVIPKVVAVHGHVYDGETHKPLNPANIYIINNRNEETLEFTADERGDFSFQATEGFTYTILADNNIRSGMISELVITDPLEKAIPFIKIPAYGILDPVFIAVNVVDGETNEVLPKASVRLYAENTLIKEMLTDEAGRVTWDEYKNVGFSLFVEKETYTEKVVDLEFDYVISGDTLALTVPLRPSSSNPVLIAGNGDRLKADQSEPIRLVLNNSGHPQIYLSMSSGLLLYRKLGQKAVLENNRGQVLFSALFDEDKSPLDNLYMILSGEDMEASDTIHIQDIHYGFDKFNLSPKAVDELDHIVRIMKAHPEVKLELKAYTDSRGPLNYNKVLAKKRVLSAFQYLIEQGIAHQRIVQTPVGEANFLKDCSKTPCTEVDHQLNRRTELWLKYEVELLGNNE